MSNLRINGIRKN